MGKLYLIPTPIGNLQDITLRALQVLKKVDIILAEDTRTSGKFLQHYQINIPMLSHHKFNEHQTLDSLIRQLKEGKQMALISDAGTPAIADPGFLLVRACIAEDIPVETLPGATAFIPALVNSGLPNDRFVFEGFLPDKKGRQTRLQNLIEEKRTMIFYVSPHKLLKTLTEFITYFGVHRKASISRELTKIHEETLRGELSELLEHFQKNTPKGEFVLILAGKE
ncbi:16S rRNA (cytidine(1402)-2'-O)-methyltransferase [Capnocytophaga sp. oral taxon 338]|jgi:probable S-adenosylmethionine-dependent methyltransferase, YraL family|uniref:16S rRNA (cytidine(1402)-2'-O)-methyltransferase n=1 Tax=Capnocytophaga sp. oral taxon 338 TaxID=710239 RepID=UPI000202C601|nr:16S rRNA (cytidine(1402)-2'-O)-methyltransferase [Capnocytophaga sp. oral taxon 338]EGD33996.1 tetrapyrrole methylase [Capnocytophaga sp. oral taxon 338 str. F0234]